MVSDADRLALSYSETFQDPERVHAIFAALRAEDPVSFCPEPWGGPGFWAVTKYDDIQQVSKEPKLFSSDAAHGGITLPSPEMIRNRRGQRPASDARPAGDAPPAGGAPPGGGDEGASVFGSGGRSMIMMDPPDHTQHRRMIAPGFPPQRLEAMYPRIRQRAGEILDRLDGQRTCEFVSAVAAELPIQMLAELFGAPQEDRHKLFEWSNIVIGGDDPEIATSRERVIEGFMGLGGYAMQLHQARTVAPGDDLISMLVQSRVDGKPISIPDYLSAFVLLVVAGNETTRNSISGAMLALSEHPAEKQKLLANPALMPQAVDEIMRWVSPVIYMRRTALADTELRGRRIRRGDKLALWYVSGNRDEEKWPDAHRFDITRGGPRHLAFGYGQHHCIGWRLAEIQLTVALEETLRRYPDIRVCGQTARLRSNFLNSLKRLPVELMAPAVS